MGDKNNEYTEQDMELSLNDLSGVSAGAVLTGEKIIPVCPQCGSPNFSKYIGHAYICSDGHKFPEPRYIKVSNYETE